MIKDKQLWRRYAMMCVHIMAAVGIAVPTASTAQQIPDSVAVDTIIAVEGVTVRGVRQTTTPGGVTGIVTQPTALPLPPVASVEDALRKMPFILVRKNSRGMAEISVRGSESRQVAVLLDGVPLTLAWDHRTDPAVIPVMGVRNLTFARGLPSILGGPNVLGGVVEVNLGGGGNLGEEVVDDVRATVGADDAGYRAVGLSGVKVASFSSSSITLRGGAGFRSSDGFALADGVVDPGSNDDLRTNSDIEELNAFASLRWEKTGGRWMSLSASGFTAERGVPPELHVEEPRMWRYPKHWQMVAAMSAGTGPRNTSLGVGEIETSFGLNTGRQDIEAFETLAYDNVTETETGEARTFSGRVLGSHTITGNSKLRMVASFADVSHTEILDASETNEYRQRLWSVGSELEWWLPGTTQLSAGAAVDGADTPETGGKPSLGTLSALGARAGLSTLALSDDVKLHASASTRSRFPALRELYSGALGRFDPNPDLNPERLTATELGATLKHGAVELQTAVFHHRLSDAVVRTSTPEGLYRRINRDKIRSTGLEFFLGATIGGAELQGDLMLQDVSVEDPAAGSGSIQPEHMPEFKAGLDFTTPPLLGLFWLGSLQHTGDQYCVHPDLGTDVSLSGETRVDMGLRHEWDVGSGFWSTVRTTLSFDNLTDGAVFDQCGMPQPGRTVRVGIEMN